MFKAVDLSAKAVALQLVRGGKDWRNDGASVSRNGPARTRLALRQTTVDGFEAQVRPSETADA